MLSEAKGLASFWDNLNVRVNHGELGKRGLSGQHHSGWQSNLDAPQGVIKVDCATLGRNSHTRCVLGFRVVKQR